MSLSLNQATVNSWLRENEQFTNEFILHWVKDHPEVHLALFKSNPYFVIPNALTEIVDHTCSKDSGVDIQQGVSSMLKPQSSISEEYLSTISSLKITPSSENADIADKEVTHFDTTEMEFHAENLRAERLEGMLYMSTHLHTHMFLPMDILIEVMHSTQHFLKCTLVHLLLNDPNSFSKATTNVLEIAMAMVVTDKNENCEAPRAVDKSTVPHLLELIKPTHLLGSIFKVDFKNKTLCVCLRGARGCTVGFLFLMYNEEEMMNLIELDLTYLELFSQICGTAIENSFTVNSMKHNDATDLCVQDLEGVSNISEDSSSGCTACDLEENNLARSISCPELAI